MRSVSSVSAEEQLAAERAVGALTDQQLDVVVVGAVCARRAR